MSQTDQVVASEQTTLIHLNKKITLFGFAPLVGFLLAVTVVLLVVFCFVFESWLLRIFTIIYIPSFIVYSKKASRNVKENRMNFIEMLLIQHRLTMYRDDTGVLNILQRARGSSDVPK